MDGASLVLAQMKIKFIMMAMFNPLTVSTRERFPVAASHTLSVLSFTAVITC